MGLQVLLQTNAAPDEMDSMQPGFNYKQLIRRFFTPNTVLGYRALANSDRCRL